MESLKKNVWFIEAILAIVLLLACFPMGYGYYRFMRIVVFIGTILTIIANHEEGFSWRNIVTGLVVILFNPLWPIYMEEVPWIVFDALGSAWFAFNIFYDKKKLSK